jgi:hypothetical protein
MTRFGIEERSLFPARIWPFPLYWLPAILYLSESSPLNKLFASGSTPAFPGARPIQLPATLAHLLPLRWPCPTPSACSFNNSSRSPLSLRKMFNSSAMANAASTATLWAYKTVEVATLRTTLPPCIFDDDPAERDSLTAIISDMGYQPVPTGDAEEALRLIRLGRCRLILPCIHPSHRHDCRRLHAGLCTGGHSPGRRRFPAQTHRSHSPQSALSTMLPAFTTSGVAFVLLRNSY